MAIPHTFQVSIRAEEFVNAHGKQIVLVGAPVDECAGQRGCGMGPDAFRTAGLGGNPRARWAIGSPTPEISGPTPSSGVEPPNPVLKNYGAYVGWTRALHARQPAISQGLPVFPIYLGGDHAMAAGTVSGQAKAAAALGRPLSCALAGRPFRFSHAGEHGKRQSPWHAAGVPVRIAGLRRSARDASGTRG